MKERSGDALGAVKFYDQVKPGMAEFAEARYGLGSIYAQAGQVELEVRAYEPLLQHGEKDDPFRISAISRLAELYISQGKAKKAMTVYQDVAKNAQDETALANARLRLNELKKVFDQ